MNTNDRLSQLREIAMELLRRYDSAESAVIDADDERFRSREDQHQRLTEEIADYRNRITQLTEE